MEVISYPSEKRMNTNINNLLYMNDENKIIIYQVFTRLFGNNNNHCVYNGDIATNGCGKWLISRSRHLVKSKIRYYTYMVYRHHRTCHSNGLSPL